jgi:hypothetical protein
MSDTPNNPPANPQGNPPAGLFQAEEDPRLQAIAAQTPEAQDLARLQTSAPTPAQANNPFWKYDQLASVMAAELPNAQRLDDAANALSALGNGLTDTSARLRQNQLQIHNIWNSESTGALVDGFETDQQGIQGMLGTVNDTVARMRSVAQGIRDTSQYVQGLADQKSMNIVPISSVDGGLAMGGMGGGVTIVPSTDPEALAEDANRRMEQLSNTYNDLSTALHTQGTGLTNVPWNGPHQDQAAANPTAQDPGATPKTPGGAPSTPSGAGPGGAGPGGAGPGGAGMVGSGSSGGATDPNLPAGGATPAGSGAGDAGSGSPTLASAPTTSAVPSSLTGGPSTSGSTDPGTSVTPTAQSPSTSASPILPSSLSPTAANGFNNPNSGSTFSPTTGQRVQPVVNPKTGALVDPTTGRTIDPTTGQPIDPSTGRTIDPTTGKMLPTTTNPTTGQTIDPVSGRAIDPSTGRTIDPVTGKLTTPGVGSLAGEAGVRPSGITTSSTAVRPGRANSQTVQMPESSSTGSSSALGRSTIGSAPGAVAQGATAAEDASSAGQRSSAPFYPPPMGGMGAGQQKQSGQMKPGNAERAGGPELGATAPVKNPEHVGVPSTLRGRADGDPRRQQDRRRKQKKPVGKPADDYTEVLDEQLWHVAPPAMSDR